MMATQHATPTNGRELAEKLIASGLSEREIISQFEAWSVRPLGNGGQWWPGMLRLYRQAVRSAAISYGPDISYALKRGFEKGSKAADMQEPLIVAAERATERKLEQLAERNGCAKALYASIPDFGDMAEVYRAIANYRTARMLAAPVANNGANLTPEAAEYLEKLLDAAYPPFHVADAMNRKGFTTYDGRRWHQSSVFMEVLRRHLQHLECQPLIAATNARVQIAVINDRVPMELVK